MILQIVADAGQIMLLHPRQQLSDGPRGPIPDCSSSFLRRPDSTRRNEDLPLGADELDAVAAGNLDADRFPTLNNDPHNAGIHPDGQVAPVSDSVTNSRARPRSGGGCAA